MSILSGLFNKRLIKDNKELKSDIQALTQFSHLQSIDERTLSLINSNTIKSTQFNDDILIDLWKEVPEISTVISQISNRAKKVPWRHFKIKDKNTFGKLEKAMSDYSAGKISMSQVLKLKEESLEPIFDAQVAALLTNPSDLQSWSEMIEQLVNYWYIIGNSYIIKLGAFGMIPDELNVMASQQTDVVIKDSFIKDPFQINKEESAILKYTFDNGNGKILNYEPDIILHMKAPNVEYKNTAWRKGFSPLASAILASKTLRQEYLSRLSLVRDRGAMGAMVGDGKGGVLPTPEETEILHKRLKKFGLGDNKVNPYIATNGAYKWLNFSFNSSELELLKGREENLKVLSRKMTVPTDLLIGDSTFNNVNTNGKIIYTSNIMPWLGDLQIKLNKLIGLTEKGQAIMPVYDDIPELQQDLSAQTTIMTTQYDSGLATLEEARVGVGRPPEAETDNFKNTNTTETTQE